MARIEDEFREMIILYSPFSLVIVLLKVGQVPPADSISHFFNEFIELMKQFEVGYRFKLWIS
jgi:hypothetical protein